MKKIVTLLLLGAASAMAQTGGLFDLSHNVIAGGGATPSTGGNFSLGGTIGQPIAGTTSTGGRFNLHGGFWNPVPLAPTAAMVSVEGRIRSDGPFTYQRVSITLTDPINGEMKVARPNALGYFRFDEVEVGRFYILEPQSKIYSFAPESLSLQLVDAVSDLEFFAQPRQP